MTEDQQDTEYAFSSARTQCDLFLTDASKNHKDYCEGEKEVVKS